MKVLLVDDEEMLRESIRVQFEGHGHEVVEAADGVAASQILGKEKFDVIISDVRMPKMDGIGLLEFALKATDIPVVFVTAHHEEMNADRARELGAIGFMDKPFSPTELLKYTEKCLEDRKKA